MPAPKDSFGFSQPNHIMVKMTSIRSNILVVFVMPEDPSITVIIA